MSTGETRPYQVVVWGATGFTGKLVCRHIAENYQGSISWAMAGRDETKLKKVKESISEVNPECENVPIITAQLSDPASLDSMISQTKVLITTVGPFIRTGTPIVEACVRNQTHYCDITGETPWVKRMIQNYHEEAQKANTKIVNCCGFDSIPFDLGVYFVAQHAQKTHNRGLQQVQVLCADAKGGVSGGTFNSLLDIFSHLSETEKNGYFTDGYFLLTPEQRGDRKKGACNLKLAYFPESKAYAATSVMALINSQIVYRSNAQQGYKYSADFEYVEGFQVSNFFAGCLYLLILGVIFKAVTAPVLGPFVRCNFLPAAGSGPSWEMMSTGYFNLRVVGVLDKQSGDEEEKIVEAKVEDKNRDGGYLGSSRYVLESALCLALQEDDLKREGFPDGGVLTPAASMGHILIQRLQKADLDFAIV
eukprot:TRINITY_DN1162_c0_g1_i4.p1 TRINITY_DN1162_c0_g1~~TRINITY_DN1162_c0_g1_i4.p1  ORF type:complete len:420 (-),score=76.07 TRINITY_DN1162_c0_g1_i4:476-1735(-)